MAVALAVRGRPSSSAISPKTFAFRMMLSTTSRPSAEVTLILTDPASTPISPTPSVALLENDGAFGDRAALDVGADALERIGSGSWGNRRWLRRISTLSGARAGRRTVPDNQARTRFRRTSTHKTQAQLTVIYSYGAATGKQGIADRICPVGLPNPKLSCDRAQPRGVRTSESGTLRHLIGSSANNSARSPERGAPGRARPGLERAISGSNRGAGVSVDDPVFRHLKF